MSQKIPKNKIVHLNKFVKNKPKVKPITSTGKNKGFVFEFEGKLVYAKSTNKKIEEGDFKNIRKRVINHNLLARKKIINASRYKLTLPSVYGQNGNYLLMEFIKSKPTPPKNTTQYKSYLLAFNQMKKNLLEIQKISEYTLDFDHIMYGGKIKEKHVFILPYDYSI